MRSYEIEVTIVKHFLKLYLYFGHIYRYFEHIGSIYKILPLTNEVLFAPTSYAIFFLSAMSV